MIDLNTLPSQLHIRSHWNIQREMSPKWYLEEYSWLPLLRKLKYAWKYCGCFLPLFQTKHFLWRKKKKNPHVVFILVLQGFDTLHKTITVWIVSWGLHQWETHGTPTTPNICFWCSHQGGKTLQNPISFVGMANTWKCWPRWQSPLDSKNVIHSLSHWILHITP